MRIYTHKDTALEQEFNSIEKRIVSLENNLPVGIILLWSGVTPPSSFVWCDGTEYAIDEYPLISSILENRGGTPSSNSKFKVPNLTEGNLRYIIKVR